MLPRKIKYLQAVLFAVFSFLLLPSTHLLLAEQLNNPLGTTDIKVVIARIIRYILGIVGGVTLLMFVWGGCQYLISGAHPDSAKKGKDTLKNALLGLVIILTASILIETIITTLTKSTSSSGQTTCADGSVSLSGNEGCPFVPSGDGDGGFTNTNQQTCLNGTKTDGTCI